MPLELPSRETVILIKGAINWTDCGKNTKPGMNKISTLQITAFEESLDGIHGFQVWTA